jgi:hypothetical protein
MVLDGVTAFAHVRTAVNSQPSSDFRIPATFFAEMIDRFLAENSALSATIALALMRLLLSHFSVPVLSESFTEADPDDRILWQRC